jgi:Na+-translocating ferredoxin:NAD+ oxidoreductase subunit D
LLILCPEKKNLGLSHALSTTLMSSPYFTHAPSVAAVMGKVLLALVPGIAAYVWYFGPAILVTIALASASALGAEAVLLKLRGVTVKLHLTDGSALITAWLLALALPPLAPWWLPVAGSAFAIVIAKQLYGGLGNNPFNPAMAGYAALIVSFPAHMTQWLPPAVLAQHEFSFVNQLRYIFTGSLSEQLRLDALTMATPFDTMNTQLQLMRTFSEMRTMPVFGAAGGVGWEVIAAFYLVGGLFLLQQRIITWHIPLAFSLTLAITTGFFYALDPGRHASPLFHLASASAVLGAFFIATDPVSGPVTPKGKLIFAAGAGFLTAVIRLFGGYPDGIAFAVLIMNMCVPLIDAYTKPPVLGHRRGDEAP